MAPSRKQKHAKTIKPANAYVHPSLGPASGSRPLPGSPEESSVNQRIEYLRRVQTPRLSIFDRDSQGPAPVPRPPDHRRNALRVAGPTPPRSWTDGSLSFKHGAPPKYEYERRTPSVDYFPGIECPRVTSLLHQAIKALAINFEWHREYDHIYLATLPVSQKKLLLSYIARYGPQDGIECDDLRLLFPSAHELDMLSAAEQSFLSAEPAGCEDVDRLDLGGSIGRKGHIRHLDKHWTVKSGAARSPPEQWDAGDAPRPSEEGPKPSVRSSLWFPALTKLSLAYPGRDASWTDLLHFSRHLGALTHLSLARWPTPRRSNTTFNNATAKTPTPQPTPSADAVLDEAVDALRHLSRNTPSLRHLSLAGCEAWFSALCHITPLTTTTPQQRSARRIIREFSSTRDDTDAANYSSSTPSISSTARFVDFTGPWRHITTLDLAQAAPPPPSLDAAHLGRLHAVRGRAFPRQPGALLLFHGDVTGPADAAASAVAPLRQVRSRVMEGERYRIVAPDGGVAAQMRLRERGRLWWERECDAIEAGLFVRAQRAGGRGGAVAVLYGWGRQELLAAGYSEAELFEAGF